MAERGLRPPRVCVDSPGALGETVRFAKPGAAYRHFTETPEEQVSYWSPMQMTALLPRSKTSAGGGVGSRQVRDVIMKN